MQCDEVRRAVKMANMAIDGGNSYMARRILLEGVSFDLGLLKGNLYLRVETAFRRACQNDSFVVFNYSPNNVSINAPYVFVTEDGRLFASRAHESAIGIWDLGTGSLLAKLEGHTGGMIDVDYSPSVGRIASSDGTIRVWDAVSGQLLLSFGKRNECVLSLYFTHDGKRIFSHSVDRNGVDRIRIWETTTGRQIRSWKKNINGVRINIGNRKLFLDTKGNDIVLSQASSGKIVQVFRGHTDEVCTLNVSPDNKYIVSVSMDKSIRVWELSSGKCLWKKRCNAGSFGSIDFVPGGKTFVSSVYYFGYTKLWDIATGQCRLDIKDNFLTFGDGGNTMITADRKNDIRMWNVQSGKCTKVLRGHTDHVYCAWYISGGKRLVSISADNTCRIWNLYPGKYEEFSDSDDFIRFRCNNSHNGKRQVWLYNDDCCVFVCDNEKNGREIKLWGYDTPYYAEFSQDDKLIVTSGHVWLESESNESSTKIRIWNSDTGECLHTFDGYFATISPDNKKIAVLSFEKNGIENDCNINILEVASGRSLLTLEGHTERINSVCYSPDGKNIVSASDDKTVRIWNADSGKCRKKLIGHRGRVNHASFSRDGRYIASISDDFSLRVWDAHLGLFMQSFVIRVPGYKVEFSPDGRTITVDSGFSEENFEFFSLQELIDQTRERFKEYPL